MVDVHKRYYKKRAAKLPSALAPPSKEMLNIWWDFRKVAEFIDINRGWLEPLLEQVKKSR